jgi:broad specificity phosphatase PhoE
MKTRQISPSADFMRSLLIISQDYGIHDPGLTEFGLLSQCQDLATQLQTKLPLAQEIELIVTSPMRRTLQTVEQSLGWLIKRGVPVILLAELQENSSKPCDTGSSIAMMKKEWPQFNWDAVDPIYPSKTGLYEFSKDAITRRGIAARTWLRQRPEKVIAVVAHSGFLRVGMSYRKYYNADFRIFDFGEGYDEIGGRLVEWDLTESKGGGLGKSPKGIAGWETQKFPDEAVQLREDEGEVVDKDENSKLPEVRIVHAVSQDSQRIAANN